MSRVRAPIFHVPSGRALRQSLISQKKLSTMGNVRNHSSKDCGLGRNW